MNDLSYLSLFTAISHYQTMWLYAMFDLPVVTPEQRKVATQFRKELIKDGFSMFQYSVYIRHCASKENAETHIRRIQQMVPAEGFVTLLLVTDRQFGEMVTFYGKKKEPPPPAPMQMELF